jgi:purine nucleosidase
MPAVGVVYNTSMSRPDAALALAALYGFQAKGEARIGSVCVTGAGLDAAIFCDIVGRFYTPGRPRGANERLPVGLADVKPLPPDPPMVKPAVEHEPPYPHSIRKITDTAQAEAVLRNGVIYNAEAVVILSAPATNLAKTLDLLGVKDLYRERVKCLVIVESAALHQDPPALQKVLAECPSPILFCGKEVGESLPFPTAIEDDFVLAPHPVVDAYRAFHSMPYEAPTHDLAAAHFAVHPNSGFFQLSDPDAHSVRRLVVDPSKREPTLQAFVEITGIKPPPPRRKA